MLGRKNLANPWARRDNLTKTQSRDRSVAMTHGSMHVEREFRLAMMHESIHALEARFHNLDRMFSLYQIAKLAELLPHCMLTRGI